MNDDDDDDDNDGIILNIHKHLLNHDKKNVNFSCIKNCIKININLL
jgi:hypothetical protein